MSIVACMQACPDKESFHLSEMPSPIERIGIASSKYEMFNLYNWHRDWYKMQLFPPKLCLIIFCSLGHYIHCFKIISKGMAS